MLTRHQSEPGRQVTAILKVGASANRCDHRSSGLWANPADLSNPLADHVGLEDLRDLAIKHPDALINLQQESVQAGDDLTRQLGKLIIESGQNLRNQ
jgi:hypothetical protein